jgi:hypothetical protein
MDVGDVASWLLKTAQPPDAVSPGWSVGEQRVLRRCVRRSYRLDLMAPGDRCVLWLSGPRQPGVHAVGRLVSAPADDAQVEGPTVAVELELLPRPVLRNQLREQRAFARAEVVRMAAGSNPSYLTSDQLAEVVALAGPDLPAGWC